MTDPHFEAVFRKMADRAWEEHQRALNPDANPLERVKDWATCKQIAAMLEANERTMWNRLTKAVADREMEMRRDSRKAMHGSRPMLYRWKR